MKTTSIPKLAFTTGIATLALFHIVSAGPKDPHPAAAPRSGSSHDTAPPGDGGATDASTSDAGHIAGATDGGALDPDAGKNDCPSDPIVGGDLVGAYDKMQTSHPSLPRDEKNPAAAAITETTIKDGKLYVVIGPDGELRGVLPSAVREDSELFVISYQSTKAKMSVSASGCDRLQTRVLGEAIGAHIAEDVDYVATLLSLGQCNADKQVKIDLKSKACGDKSITLQTAPVYNLTVGYGAALFEGNENSVGVDFGAGGTPNTAYSREVRRGLEDRALIGWFPWGFSPDTPMSREKGVLGRLFIGTTIDVSRALSSANVAIGFEPTAGLAAFVGLQFCTKQKSLGGGLVNGSVFTDDSSKLPTTEDWDCKLELPFVGISVTAELLAKLFKK